MFHSNTFIIVFLKMFNVYYLQKLFNEKKNRHQYFDLNNFLLLIPHYFSFYEKLFGKNH